MHPVIAALCARLETLTSETLILETLIPSRCLLCHGGLRGIKPLCGDCEHRLPWLERACLHCAEPMAVAGCHCGACLQRAPVFRYAVCAFIYETPVANLLNRYKHAGDLRAGYWLAQLAADQLQAHYRRHDLPWPDVILPVPLHWRRVQARGFDQGLEIARVLSRRLGLPLNRAVQRSRHTMSQQGLARVERQRNLRNAFVLQGGVAGLAGKTVALVDDVLTTGSTAAEITALLLQDAGVAAVHSWAIARTP